MKLIGKSLFILIFLFPMMNSSQADWAAITAEELAQQSDLIIVGEMIEVKVVQDSETDQKISLGIIQIKEILKGDLASETVSLRMPFIDEGMVLSSSDVIFKTGQNGLWYLQADQNNHYLADRPDRFVELEQARDQIKKLRCDQN